jgi:hypothetical protein
MASLGEEVELRPAVVVGSAPVGGDPFLLEETGQAEVNGSLVDDEAILANLLDPPSMP